METTPETLPLQIPELADMKKPPERLHWLGNRRLLQRRRVSVVGTRRPSAYTKSTVTRLASELAKRGAVVVSGAAMGVDALAHRGAGAANTVAVLPCGLSHRYPAVNAALIDEIGREGLLLSQFEPDFKARSWSFVVRNEVVVALGEVLVVGEADPGSGTMRSVEFALAMGKEIFVLPHRLGESEGTLGLLRQGQATPIYDIGAFADRFGTKAKEREDPFVLFCRTAPTYEEAARRFGDRLYEAELEGVVTIRDGRVILL